MLTTDTLTIRSATPADATALRDVAALDSAPALAGDVLLAELGGRVVAALSLTDGRTVADPFVASGPLVDVLRLRSSATPRRRRWAAWRGAGRPAPARLSPT